MAEPTSSSSVHLPGLHKGLVYAWVPEGQLCALHEPHGVADHLCYRLKGHDGFHMCTCLYEWLS